MNSKKKKINNEVEKEFSTNGVGASPKIRCAQWEQAAADARLKIHALQSKIRNLRRAIRTFERYAKEGQEWPRQG